MNSGLRVRIGLLDVGGWLGVNGSAYEGREGGRKREGEGRGGSDAIMSSTQPELSFTDIRETREISDLLARVGICELTVRGDTHVRRNVVLGDA